VAGGSDTTFRKAGVGVDCPHTLVAQITLVNTHAHTPISLLCRLATQRPSQSDWYIDTQPSVPWHKTIHRLNIRTSQHLFNRNNWGSSANVNKLNVYEQNIISPFVPASLLLYTTRPNTPASIATSSNCPRLERACQPTHDAVRKFTLFINSNFCARPLIHKN
jgi:hypothetical protein